MPKVGLVSDSHGRAETTRRAVSRLVEAGAELLLHLGDVGTLEVLDALLATSPGDVTGKRVIQARTVWGNVDWDTAALTRYAQDIGVSVDHPVGRVRLGPATLVYLHGDDESAMSLALTERPTYLCHGHSHRVLDERRGATRVINPGALFRAHRYTVALLDSDTDRLEYFTIADR